MTTIRVAILADEPLGWASARHYFTAILDGYRWEVHGEPFTMQASFLHDAEVRNGRLTADRYDVLLVPGGGVGDGHALTKSVTWLPSVRAWRKGITSFIHSGGGYVGICGGAALMTDLVTADPSGPRTAVERCYDRSSLQASCVHSYYPALAMPLLYPWQRRHPETIGAMNYVFSFAPGETTDGRRVVAAGVPLDVSLATDHAVFEGVGKQTERVRWWGGPALVVPPAPDRTVHVLARYPLLSPSDDPATQIMPWTYRGGVSGVVRGLGRAARLARQHRQSLRMLPLHTFFLADGWRPSEGRVELDYSGRPAMTAEVYPNERQGRILLSAAHPQYPVWWGGRIRERTNDPCPSLASGLHQWVDLPPFTPRHLTYTWWMVRRFTAWAAKVPDACMPPVQDQPVTPEVDALYADLFDTALLSKLKHI
jgi:hypothetical protein